MSAQNPRQLRVMDQETIGNSPDVATTTCKFWTAANRRTSNAVCGCEKPPRKDASSLLSKVALGGFVHRAALDVKSKDAHEQDSVTSKLRRGEDDNGSLSCAFRHCQVLLRMPYSV